MWKAWDNTAEEDDYSSPLFKRDLVLSWKQLSVTVVKKIPKLFGSSEVITKQILNNGKILKHIFNDGVSIEFLIKLLLRLLLCLYNCLIAKLFNKKNLNNLSIKKQNKYKVRNVLLL